MRFMLWSSYDKMMIIIWGYDDGDTLPGSYPLILWRRWLCAEHNSSLSQWEASLARTIESQPMGRELCTSGPPSSCCYMRGVFRFTCNHNNNNNVNNREPTKEGSSVPPCPLLPFSCSSSCCCCSEQQQHVNLLVARFSCHLQAETDFHIHRICHNLPTEAAEKRYCIIQHDFKQPHDFMNTVLKATNVYKNFFSLLLKHAVDNVETHVVTSLSSSSS